MISYRHADLLESFKNRHKKTYPCALIVVFPQDQNGRNDSDLYNAYMGLLDLELSPNIPLEDYMKIRDRVDAVLDPHSALIDINENDKRKFYSREDENGPQFQKRYVELFISKIKSISVGPVTNDWQKYNRDEGVDRITIRFSVTV